MALKKPSDLLDKKETSGVFETPEVSPHVTESYNKFVDNFETINEIAEKTKVFEKVDELSERIEVLSNELSEKLTRTDLENAMLSQLMVLDENFKTIQSQVKGLNEKDLKEFKQTVNNLSQVVSNLVEIELPKYKNQIVKNKVFVDEQVQEIQGIVKENITDIREDIGEKFNSIAEVIDNNLEYFNNQLQETSSKVKKTSETYNNLSKILENKILKENEILEEYSQVIEELNKTFSEFQKSLTEENVLQQEKIKEIIDGKIETVSFDVNSKIDNFLYQTEEKVTEVVEIAEDIKSEISNVKADIVIFEKHNKDTEKTIQEFSEELSRFSKIGNSVNTIEKNIEILKSQYKIVSNTATETRKNLDVIEKYIHNHHRELVELKEEVFSEIDKLPVGNIQENIERLEKKIDYIKETYSKIEPEVIVKEVIKEGLLNEPPETNNSDPLTPLNQNFVTLNQLQEHYRLFINRIQQQLSTLGGGGETRLKYLDDIIGIATNPSAYDGKYLKYNHNIGKFEFATVSGGGVSSQTLNETLQLGNTSSLGMSVGVITATSFNGNATSATYATTAGVSTSVSGGTASVTQLNVSGVSTFQNNVKIATAGVLYVGDNNDLQIYYSGSNSVIRDTGVGDLFLSASPAVRITNTNFNKTAAVFTDGGSVELYYDNSKEFETTGYGATVYGTLQSQGLNISGVTTSTGGFVGNLTGNASSATYATTAGVSTYATTAGISTYATSSGIATYATTAGVSTSVSGGTASITQLQVTGVSTFTNGPVLIGSGTSTGTSSQRLQVTGGGYISGNFGVGTTNPRSNVSIAGSLAVGLNLDTFAVSNDGDGIVRAGSNIIGGSVGTSRVNIQDRAGSFLSFYYSTGLIGRINVVNTTDLSVEVGGSERVRIHNSTGNVGVGTNNATEALSVLPKIEILNNSNADGRLILRAKPGNAYRWNIDNDGSTNNIRFFKEDDATAANGSSPFEITPTGNARLTGNLNAAGNYYVKLARTSNQTINNASDTLIGFSAISDGNSWFNSGNNRITPTVAGNYCINAMVNWAAGAATNTVQTNIQIRRNGNTIALSQLGTQTHAYTMNISAIVTLNGSTDYIEFTAYTGNPTSQVVNGDAAGTLTKLEMFKLN